MDSALWETGVGKVKVKRLRTTPELILDLLTVKPREGVIVGGMPSDALVVHCEMGNGGSRFIDFFIQSEEFEEVDIVAHKDDIPFFTIHYEVRI